jgi:hypothetical protein
MAVAVSRIVARFKRRASFALGGSGAKCWRRVGGTYFFYFVYFVTLLLIDVSLIIIAYKSVSKLIAL